MSKRFHETHSVLYCAVCSMEKKENKIGDKVSEAKSAFAERKTVLGSADERLIKSISCPELVLTFCCRRECVGDPGAWPNRSCSARLVSLVAEVGNGSVCVDSANCQGYSQLLLSFVNWDEQAGWPM